jgi:hypothetical protein
MLSSDRVKVAVTGVEDAPHGFGKMNNMPLPRRRGGGLLQALRGCGFDRLLDRLSMKAAKQNSKRPPDRRK